MRSADRSLQQAIADACLGVDTGAAMSQDLASYLRSRDVDALDVEAVLKTPKRLGVYRSLVRNALSAVVLRMLPRTRARLNSARPGRFDTDLAAFVDQVGPRTHYVRDVPAEMLAWARPRWLADPDVPAFLVDLATNELAFFEVASADDAPANAPSGDASLELGLVFHPSARLLHHGWAVHDLPADSIAEPARREVHLLAYRDTEHTVRWLELTPLAASIIERLLEGDHLGPSVARACREHEAPVEPDAIAKLLAELGARGILLGTRE